MRAKQASSAICLVALLLSLTGCFTGIESTPKITDKDLRRENVAETPEGVFARMLTADGLRKWQPGRRFVVTDSRLSMLLLREPAIAPGEVISYEGLGSEISIIGDTISEIVFRRVSDGSMITYQVAANLSDIATDDNVTVPFTVDLAVVENANALMADKRYYLLTSLRVDAEGHPVAGGRKYIPVTISEVGPGNDFYPLLVSFSDDSGGEGHVLMTVGSDRRSTRNFDNIFSYSDPRLRYPAITEEVWERVTRGEISPGMTTDECRLALGSPRDVRKGQNGGTYFERWTFDNGSYVIFEDGRATEIR